MTDSTQSTPLTSNPPPISKKCRNCGECKLLSEFDFANEKKSKRVTICKTCVEEKSYSGIGCCQGHFESFVIDSTMQQFDAILQMVGLLQESGVEIPKELLEKCFQIAHLGRIRCRYDSCSKENPNQSNEKSSS